MLSQLGRKGKERWPSARLCLTLTFYFEPVTQLRRAKEITCERKEDREVFVRVGSNFPSACEVERGRNPGLTAYLRSERREVSGGRFKGGLGLEANGIGRDEGVCGEMSGWVALESSFGGAGQ